MDKKDKIFSAKNFLKGFKRKLQTYPKTKYYEKLKRLIADESQIGKLFPESEVSEHYGDKGMRNNIFHPDLFINQIRYFRIYEYFKHNYPEMFDNSIRVLNAGDSSGLLLKAMERRGDSVNINPHSVARIKDKGINVYRANIYNLPFDDNSYDYVLAFQCLEHLESPLAGLKELIRVAKKKIFISVPYQRATKVYNKRYWDSLICLPEHEGGWGVGEVDRDCDYHIFELSTSDFINMVSYTSFKCTKNFPINYLSSLGKYKNNHGSYFNFFELEPKKSS
ncbi:MAG: class I SAM-dependent methyltransferase [Candidatus Omnitrophota bacterium]